MKKIISISIAGLLIVSGLLIITGQENHHGIEQEDVIENLHNYSTKYCNHIEFNQGKLQLHNEVIQFEISFHQDDVVDVSSNLYVSYVDETITSVYCLLTDSQRPLLEPRFLWYVPERKYSLVTPNIRLSVGKFWLVKILNEKQGKIRFGSAIDDSGRFYVYAGDTWYLTLAVPTSCEKSGYSVVFDSVIHSMELRQITRNHNLGLYSAHYNQFEGKYYSVKIHILGGCSICDVNKEVVTNDGSIIDVTVAGHRKGNMIVSLPNEEVKHSNEKGYMRFSYLGNESGHWMIEVKGWSIFFRVYITLLYIDIDPHGRMY